MHGTPVCRLAVLHRRAAQSCFALRSRAYYPCTPVRRGKGPPDLFPTRLTLAIVPLLLVVVPCQATNMTHPAPRPTAVSRVMVEPSARFSRGSVRVGDAAWRTERPADVSWSTPVSSPHFSPGGPASQKYARTNNTFACSGPVGRWTVCPIRFLAPSGFASWPIPLDP